MCATVPIRFRAWSRIHVLRDGGARTSSRLAFLSASPRYVAFGVDENATTKGIANELYTIVVVLIIL